MIGRFDGLTDDEANQPAEEGKWSSIQVVSHIVKAEMLTLTYIQKKAQTPDSIPMAQASAAFRLALLKVALRSPLRWKAPGPSAEVPDRALVEEQIAEWGRLRNEWSEFLEKFPEFLVPRAVFRHPRAGLLNICQTIDFMIEHVDHHTRQIDRILRIIER